MLVATGRMSWKDNKFGLISGLLADPRYAGWLAIASGWMPPWATRELSCPIAALFGTELSVPTTPSRGFWDSGAVTRKRPGRAIAVCSMAKWLEATRAGGGTGHPVALLRPTTAAIPKAKYANP
ncbi:hypothetical protein AQ436_03125 [Arthrobacter sp. EpRS66]|nr:hypothetical protein AQ436_03125 [Arthrobacter sp. EpRS66]